MNGNLAHKIGFGSPQSGRLKLAQRFIAGRERKFAAESVKRMTDKSKLGRSRRLMKIVFVIFALSMNSCMKHQQEKFTLGHTSFTLPPDWREVRISSDRLVFDTADGHQQLTISLMSFDAAVTFEDFKLLCEKRIESERRELEGLGGSTKGPLRVLQNHCQQS
jgi:hypothetical protein